MTETTNVWSTPTNEVTVTIKAGKGYEDSWYVFRGDAEAVKEQLIGFFALDRASVASLSPFETAVNARQIAQSISDVSAKLGAVAIGAVPSGPSANAEAAALGTAPADDPWAEADEPVRNPLYGRIEAATSKDELKLIWAENQAAFSDAELMAAWKAKGKSL